MSVTFDILEKHENITITYCYTFRRAAVLYAKLNQNGAKRPTLNPIARDAFPTFHCPFNPQSTCVNEFLLFK